MFYDSNRLLTGLIGTMKVTTIPTDEYPSKEIMDAYLDFKALLRNTWLYQVLDNGPGFIGNFKKVRKQVIKLNKAGIEKTWLEPDVKIAFNNLVKKLI